MPEMDGIEVLRLLGERQCKARILLMSGMDKRVLETAEKLAQSLGLAVVGHLQKPFPLNELKDILSSIAVMETPEALKETPIIAISDEQLHDAIRLREFVNYYQPRDQPGDGTDCWRGGAGALEESGAGRRVA